MTKKQVQDAINVMQAYLDGKEIEYKSKSIEDRYWVVLYGEPAFDFIYTEYRIRKEQN